MFPYFYYVIGVVLNTMIRSFKRSKNYVIEKSMNVVGTFYV